MSMPRVKILSVLLLFSCVSCAQEDAESNRMDNQAYGAPAEEQRESPGSSTTDASRKVEHRQSGDILILAELEEGIFEASYLSMTQGGASVKAKRIMDVLEYVEADGDFVSRISSRIENNRRLKKDSFNLLLTEENGDVHRFEYMADDDNKLYILNYRFVPVSK